LGNTQETAQIENFCRFVKLISGANCWVHIPECMSTLELMAERKYFIFAEWFAYYLHTYGEAG
jgi:hypothetical protein